MTLYNISLFFRDLNTPISRKGETFVYYLLDLLANEFMNTPDYLKASTLSERHISR